MFQKLHSRLGDFWWYSLMLFVACRSGDVIQAFIGLWLVPKYVGAEELGAVLPLQSLAGLFAAPLAVLATVFAKYVNVYATHGERGKVKCFIRDVLVAACLTFLVCIVAACVLLPHFYARLRVTAGLLTVLILVSGFMGNISLLFTNALQGLKKFKTMSVINILGAPIRLVTLLVAMPIRALSGYILGQTTPSVATTLIAFLSLRRDFKRVACDTGWRRDLSKMLRYAGPVAVWSVGCLIYSTIFNTLIRQRLPEVESAAYYMLSRFADIGGYLGLSLMVVLFPVAAEAHEQGEENRRVLKHAVVGSLLFSAALAVVFAFLGRFLFDLIDLWRSYADFASLLVPTTLTTGISSATCAIVTYEMACRRFTTIWFIIGENAVWLVFLTCFMGCEFFRGILPDATVGWMASLQLTNLSIFTWICFAYTAVQFALVYWIVKRH